MLQLWNLSYNTAYRHFSQKTNNYWATQLASDFAEWICSGTERKRGTMIFGSKYPYSAF